MTLVFIILAGLLFCFGFVLLFGAPYLPTMKKQINTALDISGIEKGQTMIELGSGDGRVALAAAQRGIKVVGYELNPILVVLSRMRCRKYRGQVTIIWGDFWRADWPPAELIFTFLLPKYMPKLNTKINAYKHRPVSLVSFAFDIKNKEHAKQKDGLFLYKYQ